MMLYLKCNQSINYDITPPIAPKMPNLGKGAECIRLLLSQVSKHMHESLFSMLFPILAVNKMPLSLLTATVNNPALSSNNPAFLPNKAGLSLLVGVIPRMESLNGNRMYGSVRGR